MRGRRKEAQRGKRNSLKRVYGHLPSREGKNASYAPKKGEETQSID